MILRYPNPVLYSCKIVSKAHGGMLLGRPGPRLSPLPCSGVMFLQSLLIPAGQQLQASEDRHTPGKGNLRDKHHWERRYSLGNHGLPGVGGLAPTSHSTPARTRHHQQRWCRPTATAGADPKAKNDPSSIVATLSRPLVAGPKEADVHRHALLGPTVGPGFLAYAPLTGP